MLSFIFLLGMIWLIFTLVPFAIKAAWSTGKIVLTIVLFPIALIWMAFTGMVQLALGLLVLGIVISTTKSLLFN